MRIGPGYSPCKASGQLPAITVAPGLTWGGCKHTCIRPTLIAIPKPLLVPLKKITFFGFPYNIK